MERVPLNYVNIFGVFPLTYSIGQDQGWIKLMTGIDLRNITQIKIVDFY